MNLNAENHLITRLEITSGPANDDHHFCFLGDKYLDQYIPINTYISYRNYDDGNNHLFLELNHLPSSICLRDIPTKNEVTNKAAWVEMI